MLNYQMEKVLTKNQLKKYLEQSKKMGELWHVSNNVLYEMCKKYPSNKNTADVVAKIFLIGRSYAASIERTKNDNVYEKKIPELVAKHGKDIDSALLECNKSDLQSVFSTYDLILNSFHEVSGKWNRSLASKYLHFHQPENFFLMDSRAKKGLSEVLKVYTAVSSTKNAEKKLYSVSNESKEYVNFYLRCKMCKQELENKFNCKLSTRDLDNLLLTIADYFYESRK